MRTPLLSVLPCLALLTAASQAAPFSSATVTRVENKVMVSLTKSGKSEQRPAAVADVIKEKDYLRTESESRAELQFPDKSLVRVGQNTVFTFDAASRTLSLQKGAMMFYVVPGSGEAQIKTPSLTAAITGTIGKVTENMIAVLVGQLKTPWGTVHAGEAISFINGQYVIFKFDPSQAWSGKLVFFNGPLPEIPDIGPPMQLLGLPNLHWFDIEQWAMNNPSNLPQPPKPPTPPDHDEPHHTPITSGSSWSYYYSVP